MRRHKRVTTLVGEGRRKRLLHQCSECGAVQLVVGGRWWREESMQQQEHWEHAATCPGRCAGSSGVRAEGKGMK